MTDPALTNDDATGQDVTDLGVTDSLALGRGVEARGERAVAVSGHDNFIVTGDLVIRFPGTDELVRPPTTLPDAHRLMFGSPQRPPASRSPARWLSADAGVIPVHPRQDVEQLLAWLEDPDEFVVRLVTGQGGQGKTVLGRILCHEAEHRGHTAGFARLPPPSWRESGPDLRGQVTALRWMRQWAEVISAALASTTMTTDPILLVIDYAENHVEAVGDLLSAIIAAPDAVDRTRQLRILLLARHDHGWWEQLSAEHPHHRWVDPEPIRLGSLAGELDADDAATVWSAAITTFAARLIDDPASGAVAGRELTLRSPVPPDAPTTLDLFAAALLLVLDHLEGAGTSRRQRGNGDPLAGVLDHETTTLASVLASVGASLSRRQVEQAMLVAHLSSPLDAEGVARALRMAPTLAAGASELDITRVADALSEVYPDPDGRRWAAPTPDRLPDTHLLRLLHGAASDADAFTLLDRATRTTPDAEAGVLVARLTRALSTPGAEWRYPRGLARLAAGFRGLVVARSLTYLTAAIDLEPALHRPTIVKAIAGLSHQDADRVDARLRQLGFATTRTDIAVAVSERLLEHWQASPQQSDNLEMTAERAGDVAVYANRLSEIGRRDEALAPTQEALTIYRGLADANPAAYLPDLARSLNNLGLFLSGIGRRDEALAPTQEALTIRRRLADANPAAYLPDLAMSLNNLGLCLSGIGRRDEALAPAQEALTIYRGLADANPAAYLPDLANSLWAVAWICDASELDLETGLRAAGEAVEYFSALEQQLPAAFTDSRRSAERTLASLLEAAGRTDEAAELQNRLDAET